MSSFPVRGARACAPTSDCFVVYLAFMSLGLYLTEFERTEKEGGNYA
jgi:hypothetical protein